MSDINTMMRTQARSGLQAQLDTAVTNGDTEAARKISDDIAKLDLQTAPKPPPYNDSDIRAELDKQPWFGTDPKKSAKAVEFGKTLDPKKFATAAAFAEALVKAVEDDSKSSNTVKPKNEDEEDDEEDENEDEQEEDNRPTVRKTRRTDGPNDNDAGARSSRRSAGPWTKLSDAPPDVQKEIKRQADKFVGSSATKEQRDKFIGNALESHYKITQQRKAQGKK